MADSPIWAKNIVHNCMAIQPGERVMLITDAGMDKLHKALRAEIEAIGPGELWEFVLQDEQRPLTALPPDWLERIGTFDVAIELFAKSILPEELGFRIERVDNLAGNHIRYAWGSKIDDAILENELSADYNEIGAVTNRLADVMKDAKDVHITTALGTDLRMSIEGRRVIPDSGLFHEPGKVGNLPAGECYVAPLEDSANGTLVVDKSFPDIIIKEPIYLTFKVGRVTDISGGNEARQLEAIIEKGEAQPDGEGCRTIGELGIGTNAMARLTGNVMTDEKVLGTVHVALGNNTGSYGGVNAAPIHIDGVVGDATLVVDGKTLIDNGNFLV